MKSPLEQFDIVNMKTLNLFDFDMSLNNIYLPVMSLFFFYMMYMLIYSSKYNFMSSYIQLFFENMYMFMYNLMKQQTGNYGLFWFPLMFTMFTFILFCNLFSLMPFGMAMTSHFMLMFWLSCTLCTSVFMIGLMSFNLKFLHIFMPNCPFMMLPMLIPMEIFSYLMRLLSLALRLAANLVAGHTLVHVLTNFIINILKIDYVLTLVMMMPLFVMLILETGIACLQAYIFTVLFCIYLADTEKGASH